MTELIIDTRENIIQAIKAVVPEAVVRTLDLGDYVFRVNNEPVLIVERKTLADYAASISDGRHREQKTRLLANYPASSILYLVEGEMDNAEALLRFQRIKPTTLVSSMFNTMLRDNLQVLKTRNTKETVYILKCFFDKLQKEGTSFITRNTPDHASNLVDSVKVSKGANITPEISFRTMLACIPAVSTVTATRIASQYVSITDFITMMSCITKETRIDFIKDIRTSDKENARKINKTAAENIVFHLGLN